MISRARARGLGEIEIRRFRLPGSSTRTSPARKLAKECAVGEVIRPRRRLDGLVHRWSGDRLARRGEMAKLAALPPVAVRLNSAS